MTTTGDADMTDTRDPLERVARIRITDAEIEQQWSPKHPHSVVAGSGSAADAPASHHRRRWIAAGAATAAAAVVAAFVVGVVSPAGSPGGPSPAAAAAIEHLALVASSAPTPVIGPGQYAYSVSRVLSLRKGRLAYVETNRFWIDTDGHDWFYYGDMGDSPPECGHSGPGEKIAGAPDFEDPTLALLNGLPKDSKKLYSYLSSHAVGERDNAEAVFVVVADLLRAGAGLTSAKIRSALIAVLARTPYVTVQRGTTDQRGRPATRIVFADPHGEPSSVRSSYKSLYFDPATAQLLEEEDGGTSTNGTVDRGVDVYTARSVVARVPVKYQHC
jgi:hypothetical protein